MNAIRKKLHNSVYNIKIPLNFPEKKKYGFLSLFRDITGGLLEISCHISAHEKGHIPHDLHSHNEEEILLLLSGGIELIHRKSNDLTKNENKELNKGQFVYYPAYFYHTFIAKSYTPAHVLSLKWKTNSKNKNAGLNFACFNIPKDLNNQENKTFLTKTLFEYPTLYLSKLHCHTSLINPGGSIKTHRDMYDVVSIILEGEVETLGEKATPYDVIFYPMSKPHGICNPGNNIAKEVVFELHTNKVILMNKIPYLLNFYFKELTKLKFWRRKLKKALKYILPDTLIKILKKL
jgi:quercetin dioxygenase-like cupin family protein